VDTATARKRLEEMCGELDKSILVLRGEQPSGRARSDSPQDPADAGTTLSETDRTEAILAAAQSQRRLVTDALVRIERGAYGVCADCGSAIPEGRLDARPEAARCVGCQSKWDRRH
jgi:DnaK suppressor protein